MSLGPYTPLRDYGHRLGIATGFKCAGCGYFDEHVSPSDVGKEITCPACGLVQTLRISSIPL